MLSKEECLLKYNALKNLSNYPILCGTENDETLEPTPFNELFKEELECFEQIINEHFELKEHYDYLNLKVIEQNTREMNYLIDRNNPPLKFEEIKKGIPVWDSINDCWVIPIEMEDWFETKTVRYVYYFDKNDDVGYGYTDFQETRFFLKEVKEKC